MWRFAIGLFPLYHASETHFQSGTCQVLKLNKMSWHLTIFKISTVSKVMSILSSVKPLFTTNRLGKCQLSKRLRWQIIQQVQRLAGSFPPNWAVSNQFIQIKAWQKSRCKINLCQMIAFLYLQNCKQKSRCKPGCKRGWRKPSCKPSLGADVNLVVNGVDVNRVVNRA